MKSQRAVGHGPPHPSAIDDSLDVSLRSVARVRSLRRLQAQSGQAFWSTDLNAWVVAKYGPAIAVLRNPSTFTSARRFETLLAKAKYDPAVARLLSHYGAGLVQADPPDHTRWRSAANHYYPQAYMREVEPTVNEICARFCEDLLTKDQADWNAELADKLAGAVISLVVGIDVTDCARLVKWIGWIAQLVSEPLPSDSTVREAAKAVTEMEAYFGARSKTDLRLLHADLSTSVITLAPRELVVLHMGVFAAGYTAIRHFLSIVIFLAVRGLVSDAVVFEDAARRRFIDEALRYFSPVQVAWRRVAADTRMLGPLMHQGDLVYVSLASANHDPDVFADPDRFCPERVHNPQIAFGRGPHTCLGAALARIEAGAIIASLGRRLDLSAHRVASIEWLNTFHYVGLARLNMERVTR